MAQLEVTNRVPTGPHQGRRVRAVIGDDPQHVNRMVEHGEIELDARASAALRRKLDEDRMEGE